MLFHNVYFWLKPDLTPAQRAEFRRGLESLAGIPSVSKVDIGVPAPTGDRPVIERSYDFALIVQCRDLAAQDGYQVDPLHTAFVATFKTFWTKVVIYDSH